MIDFLTKEEKNQLLIEFNDTKVDYPKYKTIVDIFEEQVLKTPNNIAVVFEDIELTYTELNEKSNQLAHYLRQNYTIKSDDLVGIKLDRSEKMIVAILGILKSGAAYVPIDINYPAERISYIEKDSNCKIAIDDTILETFNNFQEFAKENIDKINLPNDLAYVIYTSGSTGKPKGVMVEHNNVVRLVKNPNFVSIQDSDCILSLSNFSFDGSVFDIFCSLLNGVTLVIPTQETLLNLSSLGSLIERKKVSTFFITTALFNNLVDNEFSNFKNLKYLLFGGEQVSVNHVKKFMKNYPNVNLVHVYGPTENTVFSSYYNIKNIEDGQKTIPIGRGISNSDCYILNANNHLVPVGSVGEIYVGGDGVARGYLNQQELTAEKFVENPFMPGDTIYKTGDLGRWLLDGNIEFVGRIDHQVKIRGHRIELGEIEQLISNQDFVNQAIVVVKENEGEKFIVAYYVSDNNIDKKALQNNLSEVLPDYMLPSYYVQLERIPLTSNGKIDHRSLPDVNDKDLIKEEYVAPRTIEEEILVSIWSEVLKHDQISVKDSFYNLGGDSIKSIQVVSRVKQSGYILKAEQILRFPVIEGLAKLMKKNTVFINQAEVTGEVALTPIQYYFFESVMIPNKNHYNQSVTLKSKSFIDTTILERAVSSLVFHHDALRMAYNFEDNFWLQYNQDSSDVHYKINFYDLRNEQDELAALNKLGNELQSSFDISSGVLFHIGHFRMSDGDRLALIIHHLVIDGISWRILLEDLSALYESYQTNSLMTLPLKTDSFQKWALLQKEYAKSEKMQEERLYWDQINKQSIALLPTDHKNKLDVSNINKSNSFVLDSAITQKLQTQVHHIYNTEINDILLTGLALAIQDVFGIQKCVVKMEGHGREEIIEGADISRTLGWFTSIYPFVLDVSDSAGNELVIVKESLRKIPNKGVGYGILNYLDEKFENPFTPSVQFNYLGDFGNDVGGNKDAALFEFSSEGIGAAINAANKQSEILLDVSGMMVSDQLRMSVGYSNELFNQETIEKLVASYEKHLVDLINILSETKQSHLTPSDLTFKKITYSELSELNYNENIEDVYELSPLQQGLYYHWLVDNSNYMYFEQISYRLQLDNLSIDAVDKAFNELINRYAVLRTSFTNNYCGVPLQIVHKSVSNNFSYESVLDVASIDKHLDEIKEKDKAKGFDLEQPSQMRLKMVNLGNGDYEFIWSSHHILMDGWCLSILINDFYRMLMAISNNQSLNLPEPAKYSEYINWLSKVDKELSLKYWKNYLTGLESITEIPFKSKNESKQSSAFKNESLKIEGELFESIKNTCQNLGITTSAFMQGVWGYLLSQYNNTEDVVFGSVVSGRPGELSGVENMIGLFVNTIPVRVKYTKNDTSETYLKRLHFETLESTSHHYLNLSEVQSQSVLKEGLINNLMVFENYLVQESAEDEVRELYGQKEQSINVDEMTIFEQTHYDLIITVGPSLSSLTIDFKYNPDVFDLELVQNIGLHFSNVAKELSLENEVSLTKIDYLTASEKKQVLIDFNNTKVDYPKTETLLDLFKVQVKKSPEKIALRDGIESYSYATLDKISNQIAEFLVTTYGKNDKSPIALLLGRSANMVATILGILKSGRAYIPLDPTFPIDRLDYIVHDSQSKILISEKEYKLNELNGVVISKLEDILDKSKEFTGAISQIVSPKDSAYIIYTSGSTGNPKGVEIGHQSLLNLLTSIQQKPGINSEDTLFSVSTYSFDISVLEFFGPLISGATIYLAKQDILSNTHLLIEKIKEIKPTIIQATPSFYQMLFYANWQGDKQLKVFCGGDILSESLAEKIVKHNLELWNMYGPTETTIYSCIKKIEQPSDASSIGSPINNTQFYILDEFLCPKAKDTIGAIYIAGDGLGKGYYNNETLTNQKFIQNPFDNNSLLYDTGDVGKWNSKGEIDFSGRKDRQVKIRGYRIELGDIETAISLYSEDITQVIVDVKQIEEEKSLVVYYTTSQKIDKLKLQSFLQDKLPYYMIPGFYVELDEFPLTPNAKIDRKALPDVNIEDLIRNEYLAPNTKIEKLLASIWSEILEYEKIGIKDNFFNLGGDSIKIIRVISLLKEQNYTLKAAQILQNPYIENLAKLVEFSETIVKEPKVQTLEKITDKEWKYGDLIALSPNQKRFYKVNRSSVIFRFEMSGFKEEKFEEEFRLFLSEFPVLTLQYEEINDQIFQRCITPDQTKLKFVVKEISTLQTEEITKIGQEFLLVDYDLLNGELIRIMVFKDEKSSETVSVVIGLHHSLADNYTAETLKKELIDFFQNKKKKTIYSHPFDFVSYQKEFLSSEIGLEERRYWTETLQNIPLFSNQNQIESQDKKTDFVIQEKLISGENFKMMQQISKDHNLPLSAFFNAFFKMILNRVNIESKQVYGVLINSREQEIENLDVTKILGVIDNILPMSYSDSNFDFEGISKSYLEYLETRMYQKIPYETIREDLLGVSNKDLDENIVGHFNFLIEENGRSINNPASKIKTYVDNRPHFEGINLTCNLYENAISIKLICLKELYNDKGDVISLKKSVKKLKKLIDTISQTSDLYTLNT